MDILISQGLGAEDFDILLNNNVDLEFLASNMELDEIKIIIN